MTMSAHWSLSFMSRDDTDERAPKRPRYDKEEEEVGLTGLLREMVVDEIGNHLDLVSRTLLAATCHQFRTWFSPLPVLSWREVVSKGPLRWAKNILARSACEWLHGDYRIIDIIGKYATNPHHSSLASVFDVNVLLEKLNTMQQMQTRGEILRAFILARRDNFVREWPSFSDREKTPLFTTIIDRVWFVRCFLQREDYLTVFERHDLLPEVTRSIYDQPVMASFFSYDLDDVTLLAHIVDLARKNTQFSQVIRHVLEQAPRKAPTRLWSWVLYWHLCIVVDLPRRFDSSRPGACFDIEQKIRVNDSEGLNTWLPWLESGMIDPKSICRGFERYSGEEGGFIELWQRFDEKGLMDGRHFTARFVAGVLHKRSYEGIRFLRNWANAHGGLQGMVDLMDTFIQHCLE
jgi:hypothetical protein